MTVSRDVDLPGGYAHLLKELKKTVRGARTKALRTVNIQLIELYWTIGRGVLKEQRDQGWGSGVIRRLSEDLRAEFPDMKGLSARNIQYMTTFAGAWHNSPIAQQPVAQLPWGHITVLLDKLTEQESRVSYAAAAVEHGWSRNVLLNMIMNRTLERTGTAPSNFTQQLVAQDSELAQQIAKDPYNSSSWASPALLPREPLNWPSPAASPKPCVSWDRDSRSLAGKFTSTSTEMTTSSTCCSSTWTKTGLTALAVALRWARIGRGAL